MAVHVLAVLAYKEGDPVTSACLADSVNTNPVIIRRLLLSLQQARLIETRKGAGAGSRLSRAPHRIHLAEIYRAVEAHEAFRTPPRKPNAGCRSAIAFEKRSKKFLIPPKAPWSGICKKRPWRTSSGPPGKRAWRPKKPPFDVLFFCAKL